MEKAVFYQDLFAKLHEHRVRYALVGGVAMNLHGVPRMTMDVDIVVDFADENVRRLTEAVRALGLSPRAPVSLDELADPKARARWVKEKNMVAFSLVPSAPGGVPLDILVSLPVEPAEVVAKAEVRMA